MAGEGIYADLWDKAEQRCGPLASWRQMERDGFRARRTLGGLLAYHDLGQEIFEERAVPAARVHQ